MIRSACMVMLSLAMGLSPLSTAQPSAAPAAATQPAKPPTPTAAGYMAAFEAYMDARDIEWSELGGDPYTLVINSAILLELAQDEGAILSIAVTAQGDGSAHSGEAIFSVLTAALRAYSPIGDDDARARIMELVSQTSGQDSVPGLDIALSWTAEALEMTLTPASEAGPPPTPPPRPAPTNVNELISHCAALLPEGWTLTNYLNGGSSPDVLINIYAASTDPDGLWDCARTVLSQYWSCVRERAIECGRLSLVFYAAGTTPLLSLGIGREDALACEALAPDATTDELIVALERLCEESDALIVRHYES